MADFALSNVSHNGPAHRLSSDTSGSIKIARVLCVFFMIYVHVNPGSAEFEPSEYGVGLFDIIRIFLADSAGRASVGLLSIISGYLALRSLAKSDWLAFIRHRFSSLVIPMLLWSLAFIFVVLLGDQVRDGYFLQTFGHSASPAAIARLVVETPFVQIAGPLEFLRDLFLCMLLLPPLAWSIRREAAITFGALLVFLFASQEFNSILSPAVLILFSLGVWLAQRDSLPEFSPVTIMISVLMTVLIGAFLCTDTLARAQGLDVFSLAIIEPAYNLIRIPAAIVFWSVSRHLVGTAGGRFVISLEPFVFLAFCSHMLVLTLVWAAWSLGIGGYNDATYPLFFFAAPFLAFAAAGLIAGLGNLLAPSVLALANGGRPVKPRIQYK